MGVSTELVIGKSGRAHISAQDIRQLLRGLSGNYGICRIHDIRGGTDYNCTVNIQTAGTVKIGAGSILWNGMQIRNSEQINVPYSLTPAGSRYIVLHYTKSTVGGVAGIENVEWDVLTTEPTNTATFADNVTEAWYTYASFAVQQQVPTGFSYNSTITFIDTPEANADKLTALQTAVNAAITPDVLYEGSLDVGGTATLSAPITNYKFIGIIGNQINDIKWFSVTNVILNQLFTVLFNKYGSNEYKYEYISKVALKFTNNTSLSCIKIFTQLVNFETASFNYVANDIKVSKIIGVGKAV